MNTGPIGFSTTTFCSGWSRRAWSALAAFVLMLLLVFAAAVPLIRGRDPNRAEVGLIVAAAAIAFLVLSALFDVMSFPHGPYILMCPVRAARCRRRTAAGEVLRL